MTINSLLLKPYLDQLQSQFEDIFQEIGFESSLELCELKSFIQERLKRIIALKTAVTALETRQEALVPHELHTSYKKIKLDLRFAKRTYERFNSNQERIRKMQERRAHVAIFAA